MANWLMELTKLSKTDPTALELLRQLKGATTEEDKQKAKENGKAYIETHTKEEIQTNNTQTPETTTNDKVAEDMEGDQDDSIVDDIPNRDVVQEKIVDKKYDMSEPAFNPRLAKMGITREEELFQMHVFVRKLTREDKMEIRRSIYQKKKNYTRQTQENFRKQRAEKIAALQADPEYQKYQNQQKYVIRIVEALKNHYNIDWMLKNIEGLTVDVIRELLQTPANVNKFTQEKDEFIKNFYKRFGK
jgi:hypothetical protein